MITKYGFERGLLAINPFAEYQLPTCPEQPYDYWRMDEEDKFFQWLADGGTFYKRVAKSGTAKKGKPEYIDRVFKMRPGKAEELYDVVLFALRSGLRKGEIGALRRCDVNFANNLITVRRSWSEKERRMKNTTKGQTFRRIELCEDMTNILKKRILRVRSENDPLFDVRTWAIKNFSKYCAKAGVREIHFHSLRHTCLTNLANGYGMDKPLSLPEVQLIAGHKELSTTQRYIHTNGIENTTSRQWSQEKRRAMKEAATEEVVGKESSEGSERRFKVISGGSGIE
jgi:integrase